MKVDSCKYRTKLLSLQCTGVRQCFHTPRQPATHPTRAGYSTPLICSVRPIRGCHVKVQRCRWN